MSPKKASSTSRVEWQDRHTSALITKLISVAMQHRTEIYADSTLLEVNDHGCDRIRSKLEKVLGDLAVQHGLGKEVVKAVKGMSGGTKVKSGAKVVGSQDDGDSKAKAKAQSKRKRAKVEKDVESELEGSD